MVHAVEKLLHVALERKARVRSVSTDLSSHVLDGSNAAVGPESDATGERVRNERAFKDRTQNGIDGVVQDTVTHRGFMDVSSLGVIDKKSMIRTMPIRFVLEFAIELEDVLLQPPLKCADVSSFGLVAPKSLPRRKQVLRRNDFIE